MNRFSPFQQMMALLLAGSVAPLTVALVSQYGFGLFPCELCLWQRVPYGVVCALVLVAIFMRHHPARLRPLMALAILLWLVAAGLAFYHVGVEQGWWQSATGCSAGKVEGDLLEAILNAPLVSCSDTGAHFLGISMAAWNAFAALALCWLGLIWLRKQRGTA